MALALTMLLFAAIAPPASGARLSLDGLVFHGVLYTVNYTADDGETNRVSTSISAAGDQATIEDPGAVILPLRFTDQPDPLPDLPDRGTLLQCVSAVTSATCNVLVHQLVGESAHFVGFYLSLGDGNDNAITQGFVDGGPGDDVLSSTASVSMIGGAGADRLEGGPGGYDEVFYDRQYPNLTGTGVSVTLDGVANDGLAGEGDNVSGQVEQVQGTDGDDAITLSDANNPYVNGNAGGDAITGLGGSDWLLGADGADVLDGGAGDDSFNPNIGFDSPDGEVDTVDCGPGNDLVRGPEPQDILIGCERIVP